MKRFVIIFYLIASFFAFDAIAATPKKTNMLNPNKEIIKSREGIEKSIKSNDNADVLLNVTNYCNAQMAISRDNAEIALRKIDSVVREVRNIPLQKMLLAYKVKILRDYLDGDSYRIRNREYKTDSLPADIAEWSLPNFHDVIYNLTIASLRDSQATAGATIKEYASVIEFNDLGIEFCPTVYDFICNQAIALKNKYLFSDEKRFAELATRLINEQIERYADNLSIKISYMVQTPHSNEELLRLYCENSSSQWSGLFLKNLALQFPNEETPQKDIDFLKETLTNVDKFISRYPNFPFLGSVADIRNLILSERIEASVSRENTPSESVKCKVRASNVNQISLLLYQIPEMATDLNVKKLTLLKRYDVEIACEKPFYNKMVEVDLGKLPFGRYGVLPIKKGKTVNNSTYIYNDFRITELALFKYDESGYRHTTTNLYVVDGISGAPQKGVKVHIKNRSTSSINVKTTDSDGCVEITKKGSLQATAVRGEDKYAMPLNFYNYSSSLPNRLEINGFTDLGVYRPGETVKFAAIAYRLKNNSRSLASAEKFIVTMFNASGEIVGDTLYLKTDEFGRINGEFKIPEGMMNGTFHLNLRDKNCGTEQIWFEVAEYKMPTFKVDFDNLPHVFPKNTKEIELKGSAMGYNGVPMANCPVTIEIRKSEWYYWWRISSGNGALVTTINTTTDTDGKFAITVPAELLNDDPSAGFFTYSAKASIVSPGGETQVANGSFSLGNHTDIVFNSNSDINIAEPALLPVSIQTDLDTIPECSFEFLNSAGESVLSGKFIPGETKVDFNKIPSGNYTMRVTASNEATASKEVILYRPSDKECFSASALWAPQRSYTLDKNGKAEIFVGSKTPSYVLMTVCSDTTVIESKWLSLPSGMSHIKVEVPKKLRQPVRVDFYTIKNFSSELIEISLTPYHPAEKLKIEVESFRDKVATGSQEKWRVKFHSQYGDIMTGAALLDIYNQALDAIRQQSFLWTPIKPQTIRINLSSIYRWIASQSWHSDERNKYRDAAVVMPQWIFGSYAVYGSSMRMMKYASVNAVADGGVAYDEMSVGTSAPLSAAGVVSEESETEAKASVGELLSDIELRTLDVKNMIWMPSLRTDKDGVITVEFSVPNYNTTWNAKLIGYTKQLDNDNLQLTFTSQKPLMVQSELPRFVRGGDCAELKGTVVNAGDNQVDAIALIELYNVETGKTILEKEFSLSIAPNGREVCQMDWDVPGDMSVVGFRIKAMAGNFSDGEQEILPILTNESPVIETVPFYLNPKQEKLAVKIADTPNQGIATLEYCENPMWYCITALPAIFDSTPITSSGLANSLYALMTAEGTAAKFPQIREAIEYWKANPEDSALVSNLEKNGELKIVNLRNTPWLSDAARQTLNMQSLDNLFDRKFVERHKAELVKALAALQSSNGGWCWIKGCTPSRFATEEVLQLIGELKQLGFIDNEPSIRQMAKKGVEYMDREVINEYSKQKNKNDYSIIVDYAYTRRFYRDMPMSKTLETLMGKAVNIVAKEWENYNLPNKAFSAMLMMDHGKRMVAEQIIESIKGYSITTPNKGIYWDRTQTGFYSRYRKTTLASLMLQAIYAVNPSDDYIDGIRQYILLQKQTTDWGESSMAADAVYSILSTGSQWLTPAGKAKITLGGKVINFDKFARYTGYMKTQVAMPTNGDMLEIMREGASPSWGSLFMQYQVPMTQIKGYSTDDVSIQKTVYDIDGNILDSRGTLKEGSKVKVMLVIKAKRDMQYVAVTDERSACMEPVDQISDYRWVDGVGFYQETKDASTNLFFYYLPKGTFMVSYDATITASGSYQLGIATLQCQYAPELSAHSAGATLIVE